MEANLSHQGVEWSLTTHPPLGNISLLRPSLVNNNKMSEVQGGAPGGGSRNERLEIGRKQANDCACALTWGWEPTTLALVSHTLLAMYPVRHL